METKSLVNLEFDKVLKIISSFAGSRAAKDKLLNLEPTQDSKIILEDLAELDEFLDYSEGGVKFRLGGIRDIREIIDILNAGSCILAPEDFLLIRANIEVVASLKKAFEDSENSYVKVKTRRLYERVDRLPRLSTLQQRIDSTLDDKGDLRNDASPALSSIRREYKKASSEIEKQLNAFLTSHAEDVQDRFFTLRNDRYVVPILASAQSRFQGIVHDQSATGQTVFMEPLSFIPKNNRLAQLRLSEREEIKRILASLTNLVASSLRSLEEMFDGLVHFDMLSAKIKFAQEFRCTRPEVSHDRKVELKHARHPLIHPDCVPLEIKLDKANSCIIITGPNGGGKTVTLKTLGLNALLMQTGNYILADSDSRLPIFSEILADIGESQSIEEHLSTFTAHLKRLKEMLELGDGDSLILIDEICVGTDPVEGGALASGFLKELRRRGAYAVVTSHYDSLKQVAFTTEGFTNAAMEFDYQNFKPTFRFQMGIPGKSNALAMARSYGMPEVVLRDLVDQKKTRRNR